MSTRKDYEKLMKKYELPNLEELEETFGFTLDDDSDEPLNDIRKEAVKMLSSARDVIEPLLFVTEGSSPYSLFESHVLDDRHEDYFQLYKRLNELRWVSLRAHFDPSDENLAELVKQCHEAWNEEFKDNVLELTDIMEKAWNEYERDDAPQSYLG